MTKRKKSYLKIKYVKTAFKIANVVLEKKHHKNYIKLKYLSQIRNEKGKIIRKDN